MDIDVTIGNDVMLRDAAHAGGSSVIESVLSDLL